MRMILSITELSALTNKSRPSIYKYIKLFEENNYDEIPYSIIMLFKLLNDETVTRNQIIDYCQNNFKTYNSPNEELKELIELLTKNIDKIDIQKIKKLVEKEINNG